MSATAPAEGPTPTPSDSWWLRNMPPSDRTAADADAPLPLTADVLIIGAGLTGCAAAYWLHTLYGRGSVLIDARGVAGGATGRNGGHLWPNPSSEFQASTTADLLAFIRDHEVQCDFEQRGAAAAHWRQPAAAAAAAAGAAAEAAAAAAEAGAAAAEAAVAAGAAEACDGYGEGGSLSGRGGLQGEAAFHDDGGDPEAVCDEEEWGDAEWWDEAACEAKLRTDAFGGASHYPQAASFYPAKVAAALLHAAAPSAQLIAPVRAHRILADPDGHPLLLTDRGRVRAKHLLVATNGWAPQLLPELDPFLYPCTNQVLMTKPVPAAVGAGWGVGGLSVDEGAREVYAIIRPDGRVCVGGARALQPKAAVGTCDDAAVDAVVSRYLRRFVETAFPWLGAVEVEAEWTGVLGFTRDGKPLCGPVPNRTGVYVAAGYCGQGMVQCSGVGKAIAHMIEGGDRLGNVHPFIREEADPARFFCVE